MEEPLADAGRCTPNRHEQAATENGTRDFWAAYCRQFKDHTDSLWRLGADFRVVYRHYPMANHRFALPAARASECAAAQGRFKEMHDALYAHADSFGFAPWSWFANQAGVVDSLAFDKCLSSPAPAATIERDLNDAKSLNVTGTPTILVGPWLIRGVPPIDTLREYIKRASRL
ncbi:MAG: DsbA family protein [Gemmatimonadota bacterium]